MENRHHRELTFLSSGGDFLNPALDHATHNADPPIKEMDFFSSSPSSPATHKTNTTNRINHDHHNHVGHQDHTHRQGSPTQPVNVSFFPIWISSILHHCVLNATHFSVNFFSCFYIQTGLNLTCASTGVTKEENGENHEAEVCMTPLGMDSTINQAVCDYLLCVGFCLK